MFVISSADTSASSWGPTNTRDFEHHLEKWVWKPSVLKKWDPFLRTLTSNWEHRKIHRHTYTVQTLTTCFAIIRSTIIIYLIVSTFSQASHPKSNEKVTSIPRSQLKPGATYCIKVKSKPTNAGYDGTWSKWSPPTCWKNEGGEGKVTLFLDCKWCV